MYKHEFSDGVSVELPAFELKFGLARKLRKESEEEQTFSILESLLDEDTLDIIDGYEVSEVSKMIEGWAKESEGKASEK